MTEEKGTEAMTVAVPESFKPARKRVWLLRAIGRFIPPVEAKGS